MRTGRAAIGWCFACVLVFAAPAARVATPIAGHYPPGQSGIRGAATPSEGWSYTNFSRFFSNLEVKDPNGTSVQDLDEVRYANISMITWTTSHKFFGMTYGALAGIPFSTGNLNPSGDAVSSKSFGLGDILLTPVSLYRKSAKVDYQVQFTAWSSSGRFEAGSSNNRGSGFWSLVYSIGGVAYPGAGRLWSISAVARFEQNFEQTGTGITPGDDLVIDWGIGKAFSGPRRTEIGVSGFGTWQLNEQSVEAAAPAPPEQASALYHYYGIGPEGSVGLSDAWTLRVRAHFEFEAKNAVQGNNLWVILNCRI